MALLTGTVSTRNLTIGVSAALAVIACLLLPARNVLDKGLIQLAAAAAALAACSLLFRLWRSSLQKATLQQQQELQQLQPTAAAASFVEQPTVAQPGTEQQQQQQQQLTGLRTEVAETSAVAAAEVLTLTDGEEEEEIWTKLPATIFSGLIKLLGPTDVRLSQLALPTIFYAMSFRRPAGADSGLCWKTS